jgi:thymidylate synthase
MTHLPPVAGRQCYPPAIESYATFHDAYLAELRRVAEEPEWVNAPRGNASRERLSVAFRVVDCTQRVVLHERRRTNLAFNLAEALWYLSNRSDLATVAYYAPSIVQYSSDGARLSGSAYGPRIFDYRGERLDQWRSVINTIKADGDTKRAVIQIFDPRELVVKDNIDVACTLSLQFLVRGRALQAVSFMRANDAYRGVVSDVFSFTFLQEVLARELGLVSGSYDHHVGSYHLYDNDALSAANVLGSRPTEPIAHFPSMPLGDPWPALHALFEIEEGVRLGSLRMSSGDIAGLNLAPYWKQIVTVFELYRRWQSGESALQDDLASLLDPAFSLPMRWRFPTLFQ